MSSPGKGTARMDPIAVVEAAYELETPLEAWLQRLAQRIRPDLDCGSGAQATLYGASPAHSGVVAAGMAGAPPGLVQWLEDKRVQEGLPSPAALATLPLGHHSYSELAHAKGWGSLHDLAPPLDGTRIRDWRAVLTTDRSQWLLLVGGLSTRPEYTSRLRQHAYRRIAKHLGQAMRLRWALLHGYPVIEEAVVSPSGAILHAEGDAKQPSVRDQLRAAAARIDRARGRLRNRAPMEALDLWHGIIDGRWSLVDRFESDGRRTLVAVRNDARCLDPRLLTPRQRQTVRLVAEGLSNKEIAHELGTTEGNIGTHVASALHKLGAACRTDLAAWAKSREAREATFRWGGLDMAIASSASSPPDIPGLTPTERNIVHAALRGMTDRQIASTRGRSPRTVANQLRSIFRKLGVQSRAELAARVVE